MSKGVEEKRVQRQAGYLLRGYNIIALVTILLVFSKINVAQAHVNIAQLAKIEQRNLLQQQANQKPLHSLYNIMSLVQQRKEVNNIDNPRQKSSSQKEYERALQLSDELMQLLQQGTKESRKLALEKAEQVLKIWQKLGQKDEEARTFQMIGFVYSSNGENRKALTYFEKALSIWRERKYKQEEAMALTFAAGAYSELGNQQNALNYYQQALSIVKIENILTQQAQILIQIGGTYIKFGQLQLALQSFEQGLKIYRSQNNLSSQAATLSIIGVVYNSNGETKKAINTYKLAQEIYRQQNDLIGQAEILRNIGMLYFSLGEPKKLLDNLNEALKLRQLAKAKISTQPKFVNLLDESIFLMLIGQGYAYLGKSQEALNYNNQAISLIKKVGNPSLIANALTSSSTIYNTVNNYQKQREVLNSALILQTNIGDISGKITTLHYIGDIDVAFGKYQEALKGYNHAIKLSIQVENPLIEADTYRKVAEVYSLLGNYKLSINITNKALNIYQKVGNKQSQVTALLDIGEQERKAQNFSKALHFFEQGLQLSKEQENSILQLNLLSKIMMTYESMQDYHKGLDAGKEALVISRKIEIGVGEAVIFNLTGKMYQGLGEYDKALSFMRQSVSLAKKVKSKQVEANTRKNMGKVYNRLKNYQEAINTFNQEVELRQAIGDRVNEADALYNIAINQRALGNKKAARSQIEKTIAIIEGIRSNVDRQELRASYFATVQKYYEFYIDLLMQLDKKEPSQGYDVLALEASERSRARNLVELLNQARVDIRRNVDPKLVERERDLQQQLNATDFRRVQLLKGQYTNKQLELVKQQIEALVSDLDEVQAQIRSLSPEYASLTQSNQLDKLTLKLPEIQQQVLDENTLLLQYSLGEERSYLWAVSKTGVTSYEIPKRADIEAAINNFNQELRKTELEKINSEVGMKLSQMLLNPVANQLGQKRLLIVGDGALQTISFAALPVNKNSSQNIPLLVKHEIVTLPSASTIGTLRSKLKERPVALAPKTIAVLADPVFNANDQRLKVSQQPSVTNPPENTRFAEQACINVDRLKYSGEEAKDILSLVPENQYLEALSFDASLATVNNSKLNEYQIIHFATHGCVNNDQPELSGVVLSLLNEKGTDIDGMLRLHDIYNLNLSAELVTLSACKTGLGKDVKGEGLIGLTRGFMYAGAKRVVVSLWSVNDRTTADLMQDFYQQMLKNELHPVAALRKAQLEMWKQGKAPYYWAAFTVQGEWR